MPTTYRAVCFNCHKRFESLEKEAQYGDYKCPPCEKKSKEIAKILDAKASSRPKLEPTRLVDTVPQAAQGQSGFLSSYKW